MSELVFTSPLLRIQEVDTLSAIELLEHTTRLVELLSEQIPAFHKSRAQATLVFCAVVVEWMYKTKLEPALLSGESEGAKIWEATLFRGLMEPILVSRRLSFCGAVWIA